MIEPRGIVVVSNRLPVVVRMEGEQAVAEPGNGGLVTALKPVLRQRGGTWVGWSGGTDTPTSGLERTLAEAGEQMGLKLRPVPLTRSEVSGYYRGFSSEILWPLFHDLTTNCRFDSSYWECYSRVNAKFARIVAREAREHDFIWIHDYHLLRAATELRRIGVENSLGFFLHVPFPSPDIFARLPWRREILQGLLDFDVVGFQSEKDTANFVSCVESLAPEWPRWEVVPGRRHRLRRVRFRRGSVGGGSVTVGSFPISIDYGEFAGLAETDTVRKQADHLEAHFRGQRIVLGVDRLDYTKGLPHKLHGFRLALERHPELRNRVTLVQYVVPSRESVPGYRELRPEIERLVGEINGQFGTPGWVPVRYFYQSLPKDELCAYYRMADALMVTSLKDGMNLVAKEYCAANVAERGVLILSEFAGASAQLGRDALLINPHDAEAIERAIVTAIRMEPTEKRRRMASLRRTVRNDDVYRWVDEFLEISSELEERKPARRAYSPSHAALSLASD